MKKLIITLCALISLSSYAQEIYDGDIDVTPVEEDGEWGYKFEVLDSDFPPYYYNIDLYPETGGYPEEGGYSYMWHTDEGHISNEEKPIFFFSSLGSHDVNLTLTPRKKGDDLKVSHAFSFTVVPPYESSISNGDISGVDMYLDGEARTDDKIYVVVPLNSCYALGATDYFKVGYDHNKLEYSTMYSQSNLTNMGISPAIDVALDMPITRTVDFSYHWSTIRDDIAVVIEFIVLAREKMPISLKFEEQDRSPCNDAIEIGFSCMAGPYDPNYKVSDIPEVNVYEKPEKKVSPTEVIYTIHFQNIGEAPVDSITILDTLPPYLTFTSFEGSSEPGILSTSHVGGIVEWIIAPDADVKGTNESPTQPEPSTKGWVSFKAEIAKEEDIVYDTCYCLANVATIYFDSLEPITTAADIIVIGDSLCFSPDVNFQGDLYAQTICGYYEADSISVPYSRMKATSSEVVNNPFVAYPNPSNGAFHLKGDLDKIQRIEIFNSLGQIVQSLLNYETISLEGQPNGLYFIRILTNEEQHVIRIEKQ